MTEAKRHSVESQKQSEATARQWLSLVVLGLGLAIIIIDGSLVNVIIPAISKEFAAGIVELQWVNSIYALVFAALIVTFGRIGDQFGRRLLFILGVVVFVAGSILSGASTSIGMLIGARALQGLGAAMTSPSTLSIISGTFTGRMRGVAFGVWGAIAGAAAALGPLLGGWLATSASWRWAFYINVPIGAVAVVGSLLVVDESRAEAGKTRVDVPGILLITVGVGALVLGLIEGQTYGWLAPKNGFAIGSWTWPFAGFSVSLASLVLAVAGIVAFVFWELGMQARGRQPLFDFSLLGYRSFRFGLLTVSIVALGEFGVIFALSLYLQGVLGYTALATGLTFLPFAALTLFVAPTAGLLSARFGPKWVVTAGMLFEAVFIFLLGRVLRTDTAQSTIILILLGYGVGIGLAIAQLTNIVLSEVPANRLGAGSGANNTLRQVGAALGTAVIGAVLSTTLSLSVQTGLKGVSEIPDVAKTAIVASLDRGATFSGGSVGVSGAPSGAEGTPAAVAVEKVIKESFVNAARAATVAASLFVLLGAVSSLLIPTTVRRAEPSRLGRVG
ncbi:MAG TPA: DHA2 family efflux MFS transporter permease subunit [Spirochaetia bacterium]|nr:DHA2 family efflux MFS transporter permease subunit [Spirochaetia bacterium]